jgi:hypothetical protein
MNYTIAAGRMTMLSSTRESLKPDEHSHCAVSTGWAPSSVRTLRVLFWIEFLGEYAERHVSVPSPPVSNQPDPNIQHAADCRVIEAWRDAAKAPSGTAYCILGILPNDKLRHGAKDADLD